MRGKGIWASSFAWVAGWAIFVCTPVAFAAEGAAPKPPADPAPSRVLLAIRHPSGVSAVAVSPDGGIVATAGVDATARVWEAATGKALLVLKGHQGALTAVAFARGGKVITTAGFDGTVRLWDADGGAELKTLRAHAGEVRALSVSADGSRVASGGVDKTVCIWDAAEGADGALVRRIGPFPTVPGDNARAGAVEALALSPDGQVVAVGHAVVDFRVHVWHVRTGRPLATLEGEPHHVAKLVFSPDGATLAAVSDRGHSIQLWEAATWRLRRGLRLRPQDWEFPGAFSPDGWRLAAGFEKNVSIWDLSSATRLLTLSRGHRAPVRAIACFPDGARVASAGMDGTVVIWNAALPGAPAADAKRDAAAAGKGGPLSPSRLERLWADLRVEDAATAYEAVWALAHAPAQAVPYIAGRMDAEEPVDGHRLREWVRQLDDESFVVRERATRELGRAGEGAEPFLREALARGPSAEVAQRVEVLLESMSNPVPDADQVRGLRAIEALERAGTAEARAVLEKLGAGGAGSTVKGRARAALARMDRLQGQARGGR